MEKGTLLHILTDLRRFHRWFTLDGHVLGANFCF